MRRYELKYSIASKNVGTNYKCYHMEIFKGKINSILFVIITILMNNLYCSASNVEKIEKVIITYGTYGGYAVVKNQAIFNNLGKVFKLKNEHRHNEHNGPLTIQSEDVYNLLDSVNARKSLSAQGLWTFSDDDISTCISYLKDTNISDADVSLSFYDNISKGDCLRLLSRPDAKEFLSRNCQKLNYQGSLFAINIVFVDKRELTIRPKCIYEGAYWLVGDNGFVKDDVVIPFLRKMEIDSLFYRHDKNTTIIDIFSHNKSLLQDSLYCEEIPVEHPEVFPEFPGGNKEIMHFVFRDFKFPEETLEAGMASGRIGVSFIVEKDGSITDVQVVRSFEEHFDKVIVSAFKRMPKWKPGEDKGKKVRTKITWYMNYDYK